jgi:hypothetical protein
LQNETFYNVLFYQGEKKNMNGNALSGVERFLPESASILTLMLQSAPNVENTEIFRIMQFSLWPRDEFCFLPSLFSSSFFEIKGQCQKEKLRLNIFLPSCEKSTESKVSSRFLVSFFGAILHRALSFV